MARMLHLGRKQGAMEEGMRSSTAHTVANLAHCEKKLQAGSCQHMYKSTGKTSNFARKRQKHFMRTAVSLRHMLIRITHTQHTHTHTHNSNSPPIPERVPKHRSPLRWQCHTGSQQQVGVQWLLWPPPPPAHETQEQHITFTTISI
eukprot:891620-Pelagomonas_calceolata.AAC.1